MPRRKDIKESVAMIQGILEDEDHSDNATAALERTLALLNREVDLVYSGSLNTNSGHFGACQ